MENNIQIDDAINRHKVAFVSFMLKYIDSYKVVFSSTRRTDIFEIKRVEKKKVLTLRLKK